MKSKNVKIKDMYEIEQCATRDVCPLACVCGMSSSGHGKALEPMTAQIQKGELLWTDARQDKRIYVIQNGVFLSIGHSEQDEDVPYSLLGKGIALGVSELYTSKDVEYVYRVRSLLQGEICSVSAEAVEQRLMSLPHLLTQQILCSVLMSQCAASFTQAKINAKRSIYKRILALLLHLYDLSCRAGDTKGCFELTHSEIANLIASDRVSTTRVLHKMSDDGIIDIGYKSIRLLFDNINLESDEYKAYTKFFPVSYDAFSSAEANYQPYTIDIDKDMYAV